METKIVLDIKIYPLEAILNTCYSFLERAYIYLDADNEGRKINVFLKKKKTSKPKTMSAYEGEFMNELLHYTLRYKISKNNRKIREYIIANALFPAVTLSEPKEKIEIDSQELDYHDDPLGIAVPWEEKYGKKKKKNAQV